MSPFFPRAGEAVEMSDLLVDLEAQANPEKVSTQSLHGLVQDLDQGDGNPGDGRIAVGFSEGEVDQAVMKHLCPERQGQWCSNGMWDEVAKAKEVLIGRLTDHRSGAKAAMDPELFSQALQEETARRGLVLDPRVADRITQALVREDARVDGRIAPRTGNWHCRIAMARLVRAELGGLVDPDAVLFLRSQYGPEEIKSIAEAVQGVFDPSSRIQRNIDLKSAQQLSENNPQVIQAGIPELVSEIDQALLLIEAYAANPHWVGIKIGPEELQRAKEHARLIASSLRDLRIGLTQLQTARTTLTGRDYHDVGVALKRTQEASPGLRSLLSQYLFHIKNGIAHDPGRDFSGLADQARSLTALLRTRLVGFLSQGAKAGSGMGGALATARSSGVALGGAVRSGGNSLGRAWSAAGASNPVQSLIQFGQGSPYKTAAIIGAVALAIGATAYYLMASED